MAGIYVHIPFCRRRCLYCDFYSVGETLADWQTFVDALCREADDRLPGFINAHSSDSHTLYIGGGTPSLMPPEDFLRLGKFITDKIGIPGEFTVEVNPDDVDAQKVAAWKAVGVNRISMGIQSMVDSELKFVGRRHTSEDALKAYELLRASFDNISLDLMFGLPGQSLNSLRESVEAIIKLRPAHISVYSLMYEERSALTKLRDAGKLEETPEEDSVAMFSYINKALAEAGYERYEISNYALPGFRSRHNSSYWSGRAYLGLGPGAHSYDGLNIRTSNPPDLKSYLSFYGTAEDYSHIKRYNDFQIEEVLTEDDLREEMILTRLRTIEGLSLPEFSTRFGAEATDRLMRLAKPWLRSGHLTLLNNHLVLTTSGIMVSDEIISSLF